MTKLDTLNVDNQIDIPNEEIEFYEHLSATLEDLYNIQLSEKIVYENRSQILRNIITLDEEEFTDEEITYYHNNGIEIGEIIEKILATDKNLSFIEDECITQPITRVGLNAHNKAALMIDTAIMHELNEKNPLMQANKFVVRMMNFTGFKNEKNKTDDSIDGIFNMVMNYLKYGTDNTLTRMKNSNEEDINKLVKSVIKMFTKPYTVGKDFEESISHPVVQGIHQKGDKITLAPEYENAKTEEDAEKNYQIIKDFLIKMIENNKDTEHTSDTLAIKLSAFGQATDKDQILTHFIDSYKEAIDRDGVIFIDMENQPYKQFTFDTLTELYEEAPQSTSHIGYVLQCYRKDSIEDAKKLVELSNKLQKTIKVRIVKGAYHDKDKDFVVDDIITTQDQYIKIDNLFRNAPNIDVTEATHNSNSIGHAIASKYMAESKDTDKQQTFEMLFGLGDPVRKATNKVLEKLQQYSSRAKNIHISPYCPGAGIIDIAEYGSRRYKEVKPGEKAMPHVYLSVNGSPDDNTYTVKAQEVRKLLHSIIQSGNLQEAISRFDNLI